MSMRSVMLGATLTIGGFTGVAAGTHETLEATKATVQIDCERLSGMNTCTEPGKSAEAYMTVVSGEGKQVDTGNILAITFGIGTAAVGSVLLLTSAGRQILESLSVGPQAATA